MKLTDSAAAKRLLGSTLFRYALVGGGVSLFDIVFFNSLIYLAGSYYLLAALVSNACSFFIRFFLQKHFAFQKSSMDGVRRQLLFYGLLFAVSIVLTGGIMFLLVGRFGLNASVAQIVTIALVAGTSFFVYRHVVFPSADPRRLLIFTQKMDRDDFVLGFFHDWVKEFGLHFDAITVVCLGKGNIDETALKERKICVRSLGKEKGGSRLSYIFTFYKTLWDIRGTYGSVFVHMNQEYVLMGGLMWHMFGRKVYMWRNHHAGNILTDIAAALCHKVFCTSKYSYTAKYKKTVLMPVGVDTELFKRDPGIAKVPRSLLFLGRIAPVKKPDALLEALDEMKRDGTAFAASVYGDPLPKDASYRDSLKDMAARFDLRDRVSFHPGVPHGQTVSVYNAHEVFVNLSSSGMYDKTIFEAMACETLVLASNRNLQGLVDERFIFAEGQRSDLVAKLTRLLNLAGERQEWGRKLREIVMRDHSLSELGKRLEHEICS